MAALAASPNRSESVLNLAKCLAEVIEQAAQDSTEGRLPDISRERRADLAPNEQRTVTEQRPNTDAEAKAFPNLSRRLRDGVFVIGLSARICKLRAKSQLFGACSAIAWLTFGERS